MREINLLPTHYSLNLKLTLLYPEADTPHSTPYPEPDTLDCGMTCGRWRGHVGTSMRGTRAGRARYDAISASATCATTCLSSARKALESYLTPVILHPPSCSNGSMLPLSKCAIEHNKTPAINAFLWNLWNVLRMSYMCTV